MQAIPNLVTCTVCSRQVSRNAPACPGCGEPSPNFIPHAVQQALRQAEAAEREASYVPLASERNKRQLAKQAHQDRVKSAAIISIVIVAVFFVLAYIGGGWMWAAAFFAAFISYTTVMFIFLNDPTHEP
jgi:hypothetical protein